MNAYQNAADNFWEWVEHVDENTNTTPTVSVRIVTYNHHKYIRQALDGILMQKTSFPMEVVIFDDKSTDGTRDIVREYQNAFPASVRLLLPAVNTWDFGSGKGTISGAETLKVCRGKYIALLEGDDYWTDPYKLQKQVDFLEGNAEFAMCSHEVKTIFEGVEEKYPFQNPLETATFEDIITHGLFIPTLSICFKASALPQIPWWFSKLWAGQRALILLVTHHGKNYHMNEVMGVKRKNPGGVTTLNKQIKERKSLVNRSQFFLYVHLNKFTNYQHHSLEPLIVDSALKTLRYDLKKLFIREALQTSFFILRYPKSFFYLLRRKLFSKQASVSSTTLIH